MHVRLYMGIEVKCLVCALFASNMNICEQWMLWRSCVYAHTGISIGCLPISEVLKIVNEYDQEIIQSKTADNPVAPRGRAAQQ